MQRGVLGASGAQPGAFCGRRAPARGGRSAGEPGAWSGRDFDGADRGKPVGSIADAGGGGATSRARWGSEGAAVLRIGALHVHGVDGSKLGEGCEGASAQCAPELVWRCRPMPFQRQARFTWLEAEKASGDVSTMGLSDANHPAAWCAATPLADSDGFLLTGRLSSTEPGWLCDHAVFGTVLVPGTGLLELGFAAARAVGLTTVSQLTLVSPLVLPAEGSVRLQVQLEGLEGGGEDGRRGLSIYSRAEDAPEGASWRLHAQGVLGWLRRPGRMRAATLESGGLETRLRGVAGRLRAAGSGSTS